MASQHGRPPWPGSCSGWRPPSLVGQVAAIWTTARPIEIDAGVRLTEFLCTSPSRRGELVERIGAVQPPPASAWAAHFATARDLFLDHMALRCLLVSAVIEQDRPARRVRTAKLKSGCRMTRCRRT